MAALALQLAKQALLAWILTMSWYFTSFQFSLYGEHGSNELAKEWCQKSHHYMQAWLDSGGLETLESPESHNYADPWEFLEWACTLGVSDPALDQIVQLRRQQPRKA